MTTRSRPMVGTVDEVMTAELLTIAAGDSVFMAWALMCKAEVHHLPVVDDEGAFLGVVDAHTLTAEWGHAGPDEARRPVAELLIGRTRPVVHPGALLRDAARAMLDAGTDYVAVTNERGALVGLLTARDLLEELAGTLPAKAPRHSGMPSLYRIEPVLPASAPGSYHPGRGRMSPG